MEQSDQKPASLTRGGRNLLVSYRELEIEPPPSFLLDGVHTDPGLTLVPVGLQPVHGELSYSVIGTMGEKNSREYPAWHAIWRIDDRRWKEGRYDPCLTHCIV